jgi:hypothetical protein
VRKLGLLVVAANVLWMVACGGGGGSSSSAITSLTVGCTPSTVISDGTSQCTATVSGTGNFSTGVSWSASGGHISSSGTFTAPTVTVSTLVTITATSTQDSSKSGTASITVNPTSAASNVQPVVVDQGPDPQNFTAVNEAFTTVTVCVPGTNQCQNIDHVLVDTGSSGLRLLQSALTITLPQSTDSNGNPLDECLGFLDGYVWGPVVTADIDMGSESASSSPVQVIIPSSGSPGVPSICSAQNTGSNEGDSVDVLGANGVLGVSMFAQDCGDYCVNQINNCNGTSNDPCFYFACTSSGCNSTNATLAQQLPNPVTLFATDNNGLLLQLPAVGNGGGGTTNGSLIFGIGTQSNNALGNANVYQVDQFGNFTTTYKDASYPGFLDSGSNGYFFSDSSIPSCPSPNQSWFCPSPSPDNLSAQNQGTNMNTPVTANFTLEDASALFSGSNVAFSTLGGGFPIPQGGTADFDWGLSFFYGKNIFTAIDGMNTPAGPGPYTAF